MRRLYYAVTRTVDKSTLALRVASPEDEDEILPLRCECIDDSVGENLPPLALMRAGAVGFDCQRRVEEKYALVGPREEVGHFAEFGRNVPKRGRGLDIRRNIEA